MIAQVKAWYVGLSAREQGLVITAGVLAGLVALVYCVVLPIGTLFEASARRQVEHTQRAARLLAALDALNTPVARLAAPSSPVDQQVAASAEAAGLVLQSNQPRGNDMTTIAMGAARPTPALGWLDGLAARGLVVESLTMTPAPDGTVSVSATLKRSGT